MVVVMKRFYNSLITTSFFSHPTIHCKLIMPRKLESVMRLS
uniref:Uncharacterized protein n=1 Tax=Ciona intestinalis TaxID=7719 RepID=H2XLA8_CIOIN